MKQPFVQRFPELVTWADAHELVAPDTDERWPWERERVELGPLELQADGEYGYEVVRGFLAVAYVMCEAAAAHNPLLVLMEVQRWIQASRAVDDSEKDWRRGWERQLDANPVIALAMEQSREQLLKRAGIPSERREVFRRWLDGEPTRQIARDLMISPTTVRKWLDEGLVKLQMLRADKAS